MNSDTSGSDTFSHHIGRLLQRAHRDYAQRAISKLRASGYADLAQFQAELLSEIATHGERISAIAKKLGMSKQAAGETVGQLEKMGFLTKIPDTTDSRATLVELTPQGQQFIEKVRGIKKELDRDYIAHLGDHDFDTLRKILEKLLSGTDS